MSELTEFLLARIAEEEAVARAATDGPWWYDATKWNSIDHEESVFAGARGLSATTVASTGPGNDPQSMADADHIARHDPARVLRECAAKRRIVDQLLRHERLADANHERLTEASAGGIENQEQITALRTHGWELRGRLEALKMAAESIAAVYADHPDHRDEWRP